MSIDTRRIVYLTGTRADFGKLKPLILDSAESFDVHVFVTGMHMLALFGHTYREVEKAGVKNIYKYINQTLDDTMDVILAKTIQGFSDYMKETQPDMIVVHGDRVEALAGAIVGSLNNILVGHIEGGELSGTIDGSIRHSITKLSHLHFVANQDSRDRLRQLGEDERNIFVVGSPDLDVMCTDDLPDIAATLQRYEIPFTQYGVAMFHPVTTEYETIGEQALAMMEALEVSGENVVVIYPNNDHGSVKILDIYRRFEGHKRFKFFPSIRFEHFLTLLKNARVMVGNSSAGVREAPFYGVPSVDIGTRQTARLRGAESTVRVGSDRRQIVKAISDIAGQRFSPNVYFGDGNSTQRFMDALREPSLWNVDRQKAFIDLDDL